MSTSGTQNAPLTAHQVRQIAVASQTDPRTVRRVLAGKSTKDMVRGRVLDALRAAGLWAGGQ
jgi:hypothetical protein